MSTTHEKILIELSDIFRRVMGVDGGVHENTLRADITEWDSINHLDLIVELEEKYHLGLSMEQIEKIDSVKEIVKIISEKKSTR